MQQGFTFIVMEDDEETPTGIFIVLVLEAAKEIITEDYYNSLDSDVVKITRINAIEIGILKEE